MRALVLNGPNLGRLGRRQPEIYGHTTYHELVTFCIDWGRDLGLEVEVRQTNHEGELLDWLNTAADEHTPVVLNAAAWTHYSYALSDACAQLTAPLVEVHISDPASRPEEFRHTSVVTPYAKAVIVGPGHRRLSPGSGRPALTVGRAAPLSAPPAERADVAIFGCRDVGTLRCSRHAAQRRGPTVRPVAGHRGGGGPGTARGGPRAGS